MMRSMRLPHVLVACIAVVLLASCGRSHVVREGGSSRPRSADSPVRVSQPKYGATVVVQRGQNVYRIATENGLTALDLALWNDIPPPYTIHPGQRLRLYPGAQGSVAARPATTPPKKPAASTTAPPRTPAPTPVVVPATSKLVDRMTEAALVQRSVDPDDHRRVILHISDFGLQKVAALERDVRDHRDRIGRAFGTERQAQLSELLQAFIRAHR